MKIFLTVVNDLELTDPPRTDRIASINPANGKPVCCIGIVFVTVVIVLVCVGITGFTGTGFMAFWCLL
jgi:t-SNARE complex subunit (syntaxin)